MKVCAWSGAGLSLLAAALLLTTYRPATLLMDVPLEHQSEDGDLYIPFAGDPAPGRVRAVAQRGDRLRLEFRPYLDLPWLSRPRPLQWALSREGGVILEGRTPGLGSPGWAAMLVPLPLLGGLLTGALLGLRRRPIR